jgi:hypothetical protein
MEKGMVAAVLNLNRPLPGTGNSGPDLYGSTEEAESCEVVTLLSVVKMM